MVNPHIFQATPDDAQLLANIHASAFPSPWSAESIHTLLTQPTTRGLILQDAAFGLFQVVGDEAEILTLATHPDHRRKGLARAIVEQVSNLRIQDSGFRIFLDVATTNTPAIRLYESLGFSVLRTRKAYYADGTDALVMQKTLD